MGELNNKFEQQVREYLNDISNLLVEKNIRYGNSALTPLRIFSISSPLEQLKVRIDDKLSRIKNYSGNLNEDEDVVTDLIGYLVLLKICMREE